MKNFKLLSLLLCLSIFYSCTDLTVEELDSVVTESETGEFTGVDVPANLTDAYNRIYALSTQENLFALNEVSSDEALVPTRGTDWGDNRQWSSLHLHTWDSNHPFLLNVWNQRNEAIYALNLAIDPRSGADDQQLAEAKFLRALNMFFVLDLWGQVPFRNVDDKPSDLPEVLDAAGAVEFIQSDLEEALPDLPVISGNASPEETLKASQASCNFLIAKFYLNKHVYLGQQPENSDMDRVIEAVNEIEAAGFDFGDDYFDIFAPESDPESIMTIEDGNGAMTKIWLTLHYSHNEYQQNTGGGWNGFATTADFYNLFEGPSDTNAPNSGQEERRGFVPKEGYGYGFLIGQQYGLEGQELTTRSGEPLVFTPDFPDIIANPENTGIRVLKYHPEKGDETGFVRSQILFRYADAALMKAEAFLRKGDAGSGLIIVNELREARGVDPFTSLSEENLLEERGRELYWEGWRRIDQIRFGTFTDTWDLKDNTEEFRVLYPIPTLAISSNPNLVQNPGY